LHNIVALPFPNLAVLAVAGLACGYAVIQFGQAWFARRWPAVEGEIFDSRVVVTGVNRYGDDIVNSLVSYRYHVEGQPYTNNRVRFGQLTPNSWLPARNRPLTASTLRHKFPHRKPVRVHYDPRRPENSVLYLTPDYRVWILLAVGIYLAVAGVHGGMWPLTGLYSRSPWRQPRRLP
jgi:hypothetical protein